ncbi:MAG: SHOCT domain-containing protein [Planctomycetota bacterium]
MLAAGFGTIFLTLAGLFVLALLGFFGVIFARNWVRQPDAPVGFGLSELRELRRKGEISEEEFDRMKANIVEAHLRRERREAEAKARLGQEKLPTDDLKVEKPKNLDLMQR